METSLVILAAGKGTRMQSDLPKVLHQIAHAPLLAHAIRSGAAVAPTRTVIVAGHEAEAVAKAAKAEDDTAEVVLQTEQLGTGHAVMQARAAVRPIAGSSSSQSWLTGTPSSSASGGGVVEPASSSGSRRGSRRSIGG